MLKPKLNEIRKPTKTISGITPIAVMLPPKKCEHGNCLYCPDLNVPQSYTPKSPVVMRAREVDYNAYKQVKTRIKAFKAMHHPTDKIELIIMGGTFLEYPKKFKNNFIKKCYDALNNKNSKNLEEAQKLNEISKHRCVALCIETRPDVCIDFIQEMRKLGATRVELGVQILDDKIYKEIKRGHTIKDVVKATKALKNAGFKIGYHIMPGLPGSNLKKDFQLFKKIFRDKRFKPDQLKIYPCQVIPGSELEEIYWKGKYKPYTKEQTKKILLQMLKVVPRYCRVMRIMREIPPDYLTAGILNIDLRKDIEAELRSKNLKLEEIRYREVGFNLNSPPKSQTREIGFNKEKLDLKLKLKITKYKASDGEEYFLEIVNKDDILFGLLRLRIFNSKNNEIGGSEQTSSSSSFKNKLIKRKILTELDLKQSKFQAKRAIIRELHIYGQSLKLGQKSTSATQHKGFGRWLMSEAEKITKQRKIKRLSVISGVGVREYYKKLGYKLENTYMIKDM